VDASICEPLEEIAHVLLIARSRLRKDRREPAVRTRHRCKRAPGLVTVDGPVLMGADFANHSMLQYHEGFPGK